MVETITLVNGVNMPRVGLGVFKVEDGQEVEKAISYALAAGYRSIDTAKVYNNEVGVGKAIKASGIPREELFITSKLWNTDQGYEEALQNYEDSLQRLGLDYLDLYLIHWPVAQKYKDSWRALEKLYTAGKVRAIGVSNFHIHHLEDLLADADVVPMINQVEMHPQLAQDKLSAYCQDKDIVMEAWGPLGQGHLVGHELLKTIGEKYNKTAAQVILRWHLQRNTIIIPKSVHENRIQENFAIFDFVLTPEDMKQIATLNSETRFGTNPDTYDTK